MLKQRKFEEKVGELYAKGLVPGVAHPYIGEEAVAAGVCAVLKKSDYVVSYHRGHGHSLAKGVPAYAIFAELLGRETGVCRGLGGSMHATDLDVGVLFSTAIVGGGIPIAAGAGLALKLLKQNRIVACFFGDGASTIGGFHEAINLASLWKLPVIFVCENNMYAISVHVKKSVSAMNIADRAVAYNIPGEIVDGMDVVKVYDASLRAAERARRGDGPSLLECQTYRYRGHGLYDTGLDYRTKEEIEEWTCRDPIRKLGGRLVAEGFVTSEDLVRITEEIEEEIESAAKKAMEASYPAIDLMYRFAHA